ncbi:hypothetical protein B0J12DRAFT_722749 [Macrophomina phaseolina]|uniref:Uncharacterized protein n=1 Tax=Macrophomina phaseolina TaxID=35725 RepID=A0ABQ8GWL6_9PEZI|nr:hypothetical protein B0J12DRAFT_722749 [Macrophomina phaseolina]
MSPSLQLELLVAVPPGRVFGVGMHDCGSSVTATPEKSGEATGAAVGGGGRGRGSGWSQLGSVCVGGLSCDWRSSGGGGAAAAAGPGQARICCSYTVALDGAAAMFQRLRQSRPLAPD